VDRGADRQRLVVLADDFTGACDAAGAFGAGRGTLVVLDVPERWPALDPPGPAADTPRPAVEVLSIDLDLRERPDAEAQERTRAAAERVEHVEPAARLFLKIDSTLRGPIAGLVAGALGGSGKRLAVLAPAFPEQGRLLLAGRSVVAGTPGHSLIDILGAPGTILLSADLARSRVRLELAVEQAGQQGARHVVIDADTPECLRNLAAIWSRHADWLLVGSGGLARHVSRLAPPRDLDVRPAAGPILVVAGSPSPMTRVQIEHLRPLASVTVVQVGAPPPSVPHPQGEVLVVCTPPATERDSGQCARAVADTVLEWSGRLRPGAVVLAGGATARLVCERLRAVGVRLLGELAPGVPLGHLVGGEWDTVMVITKAGGFGTPTTLLDAVHALVAHVSDPRPSAEGQP